MNNRWCPNLELLFWYTVHFPQSSFTQRKEECGLHLCHVQYNLLMHLYLNVCWRGREIRREREVETVKKRGLGAASLASRVFGAGLGSTAGSSGGSLEGVGCVWGCGAWARCRSGWECGCSAGGRKDSGRIRSPGRWVPEEHSLSVLRRKGGER